MIKRKKTEKLLTLFFPKRCAVCDGVIIGEQGICNTCVTKVRCLDGDVCMTCGKRVKDGVTYCYDCSRKKHAFVRNFAVFEYSDVREGLYRFKYNGRAEYAGYYAKTALVLYREQLVKIKADAIIPIPLHKSKYRKRGYNQAEEFARELSFLLGIPLRTDLLLRVKRTKPMKTLDVTARQNNLKKAFLFTENDVKLSTIILVDDIFTTGATLDAAAQSCREAGVDRVFSITVAVGHGL